MHTLLQAELAGVLAREKAQAPQARPTTVAPRRLGFLSSLSMAIEFSPTAATNFPTGGHLFSPLVATNLPTNRSIDLWCVR